MEKKIITAWVVKDKKGGLYLYELPPNKTGNFWTSLGYFILIDRHLFPFQVECEDDESTEVKLTIKICK